MGYTPDPVCMKDCESWIPPPALCNLERTLSRQKSNREIALASGAMAFDCQAEVASIVAPICEACSGWSAPEGCRRNCAGLTNQLLAACEVRNGLPPDLLGPGVMGSGLPSEPSGAPTISRQRAIQNQKGSTSSPGLSSEEKKRESRRIEIEERSNARENKERREERAREPEGRLKVPSGMIDSSERPERTERALQRSDPQKIK